MENIVLKLDRGKECLAELQMKVQPGSSPMLLNYECTLDGDPQQVVTITGVPKRADLLQVASDALHLLGYGYSGRKAHKPNTKKKADTNTII